MNSSRAMIIGIVVFIAAALLLNSFFIVNQRLFGLVDDKEGIEQ